MEDFNAFEDFAYSLSVPSPQRRLGKYLDTIFHHVEMFHYSNPRGEDERRHLGKALRQARLFEGFSHHLTDYGKDGELSTLTSSLYFAVENYAKSEEEGYLSAIGNNVTAIKKLLGV